MELLEFVYLNVCGIRRLIYPTTLQPQRKQIFERVSFLTELHVHPNNQTKIPQYKKIGPNHRIGYIAYSDNALQTL